MPLTSRIELEGPMLQMVEWLEMNWMPCWLHVKKMSEWGQHALVWQVHPLSIAPPCLPSSCSVEETQSLVLYMVALH